jgi:hypothetical protein
MAPIPPAPAVRPRRAFLLDTARCLENRAYYRQFIDFAADRGIDTLLWHFTDDQGCSLQFDRVPGIASPNAYTKAEMRDLVRYAKGRGVAVVPELASLGHCRYLTRLPAYHHLSEGDDGPFSGMCPVSVDTRRVLRDLIEEACEVFEGPDFHVGLDEVNIGGHPLTRAALRKRTRGQLLADHVRFVHGVVTAAGKRMWMWADGLLAHPEMLADVPRDVVACNWQYTPEVSPDATRTLLDAGLDVMLCSALISHDQPLFPGERFALPNVRAVQVNQKVAGEGPSAGRVLGHCVTVWTPVRYLADSLWVGLDLAAAVLGCGPAVDADARLRTFGASFHGLAVTEVARFAEAVRTLLDDAPVREEWVAVAKLSPLPPAMLARVTAAAARWSAAHAALVQLAPLVRRHGVEYGALTLLVEVLAHAYDAAAQSATRAATPATLARLVARGEAVLAAVDAAWDRERYADDPRKYAAPVAAFQDDHLVPLLQAGVVRLRAREAAAAARAGWAAAGPPTRRRRAGVAAVSPRTEPAQALPTRPV